MNQERKLSFFLPPISPVKDANGKNVTPATLVPHKELTLEEVWNIVTGILLPELVFVSPGGHGVKAFVPYDLGRTSDVKQNAAENIYWLMEYARLRYGDCSDKDKGKGVDYSGKDLVRACFLSHDERALMRVKTPMG